jgi:hypothetical protein
MSVEAEIAHRRKVWIALADLFLDTDVRISYPYIARTLAESPYSMEDLRAILDHEVTPVVESNLLSVAGEWAGFNEEKIVEQMAKRMGKARRLPSLVSLDREWNAVEQLARLLRTLPAGEILQRTQVWDLLMPLIRNRRGKVADPSLLKEFSLPELEAIFRRELWPALIDDARRLARLDPQIYPDEREIESNWLKFAAGAQSVSTS